MTAVLVRTTEDLQAKYRPRISDSGAEFRSVLESGRSTSIADRVQRSARVASIANECSRDIGEMILRGDIGAFDVPWALVERWKTECTEYFNHARPAGLNAAKRFDAIEDINAAAADLRRVCAEAGVAFQVVETQPHIVLDGGSIREGTCRIAAKTGHWAMLVPALGKVICDTLAWDRSTDLDAGRDAALVARRRGLIRTAVDFMNRLTLLEDREKTLETLVLKAYLTELEASVKAMTASWTVKRILDDGSAFMRRELDRCEKVLVPFSDAMRERTRRCVQTSLFSHNAQRIATDKEHGASAALQYPLVRGHEFANLALLLEFSPDALRELERSVEASVAEAVAARVAREGGNPIRCLGDLVRMTGEYTTAVTVKELTATVNLGFCVAVQAGAMAGLPDDGSVEEAFVALVDGILKEKKPDAAPDTRGARLVQLMGGFNLVRDTDLFCTFYKRQLAARLTLLPHRSMTLERTTVDAIAHCLGTASVRHVQLMLQELDARKNSDDAPLLVNALVWPSAERSFRQAKFVESLSSAFDGAVTQRSSAANGGSTNPNGNSKRAYFVDPHLTRCEVAFVPDASKPSETCQIMCSATQANVLASLGRVPVSAGALAEITQLPLSDVMFVVNSFARSGLVNVETEGTEVKISVNTRFLAAPNAKRKLVLPSLMVIKRASSSAPPPPAHQDPTDVKGVSAASASPVAVGTACNANDAPAPGILGKARGALAAAVVRALSAKP